MSILQDITKFVDNISDQVTITFKNISDFLDSVQTFFVSMGFWLSVLMFFLILILLLYGPIYVVRYWEKIKDEYKNIMSKVTKKAD